jgi:hypothetical protein
VSRLTVRLPDTLHRQLNDLADQEGVSLNQYIVYALTRQTTLAYTVQTVPTEAIKQQRAAFTALLQSLGQASMAEIEQVLAEREVVEPEAGLSPEIMEHLQVRLKSKRAALNKEAQPVIG